MAKTDTECFTQALEEWRSRIAPSDATRVVDIPLPVLSQILLRAQQIKMEALANV